MRRQALDVFVNRVASHQELQQSEDLRIFLTVDEQVINKLELCSTKKSNWTFECAVAF